MKIWHSLSEIPSPKRCVVTIGNFDGMHRGHQKLVDLAVQQARKLGVRSVGLTFDPHPRRVHQPERKTYMIMTLQQRLEAMAAIGLDSTLVARYDEKLYRQTAEEFVVNYLVDGLKAIEVIVGQDFKFGRNNEGSVDELRQLGEKYGFSVLMVPDIQDESGRRWSSSWVRELLEVGNVAQAARVLGRSPRITGIVRHGNKRGRILGFPTANLFAEGDVLAPCDGVYAGWLVLDVAGQGTAGIGEAETYLPAAISVGTNPQFEDRTRTVEAHVLGRGDLNLYGQEVTVVFVQRLRDMMKFDDVEQLKTQMDDDLLNTAVALGVRPAGRVDPATVTAA